MIVVIHAVTHANHHADHRVDLPVEQEAAVRFRIY